MNKKVIVLIGVVVYLLSAYFSYSYFSGGASGFINPVSTYTPPEGDGEELVINENTPRTEGCPLNGEMLTEAHRKRWEQRRPLGVVIENHQDARPQSGLTAADIVYEAVAEGGITRFLAIFYCKDTPYIGPIRSARIYFIDLLAEYGRYPLYAHVGGANTPGPADALGEIRELNWSLYNDLDQFAVSFPYYWRDYERLPGRVTEHTVYSSTEKLWKFAKENRNLTDVDENKKSWDEEFEAWQFKDGVDKKGKVHKISFNFWSGKPAYAVEWNYDSEKNSYKRVNGGKSHFDKNNDKQIEAENVMVAFMKESPANDGYPGGHLLYDAIGQGDAIVFQDGRAIEGAWRKKDRFSRIKFYDQSGKEIALNRGQVFIEVIPIGNEVSY